MTLRLLAASVAILSISVPVLANETSQITASVADLHVKPAQKSRTTLRLGQGHEVEVVATSDDGKWVQVRGQLQHWEDQIAFSGWIPASAVDLASKPLPAPAADASAAAQGTPAEKPAEEVKPADAPWTDAAPVASPAATVAPSKPQEKPAPAADTWADPGASPTPAPAATPTPSGSGDDFFNTLK